MQAEGDSYSAENVTDDEGGIREGAEGYSVLYGARILGSKDGKSNMLEWNAPTGYSPERWKVEDSGLNEAHDVINRHDFGFCDIVSLHDCGEMGGLGRKGDCINGSPLLPLSHRSLYFPNAI